jgi:membrane protein YdbS with pleckstrin-like domain
MKGDFSDKERSMVKCPYCGKEFDETAPPKPKIKWYFTTYWVVIALLSLGPFALPLIWYHPRYKPATKWIISVLVIIITIYATVKSIDLYHNMMQQYNQMQHELGGI